MKARSSPIPPKRPRDAALVATMAVLMLAPVAIVSAPPLYDHVVVVIEENHSFTQIIGNYASAPYVNSLADAGVLFTNFYAVTHPSQPNYLEFFSGSNQGVTDDNRPLNYPWSTPNLGAELLAAGLGFGGYSEDLPAIGDADTTGTNVTIGSSTYNLYRRKHNPWANWQAPAATNPIPPNQLPASTNRRWIDFPADFTQLPHLAIVVPNEQNDMHDGTVKMGDDWLAANLSAYAEWAKTHNSLLIVTWDEDNFSGPNRIPTILYGANLQPGQDISTWTLHNLLRTIEDMFRTAHTASAAFVRPITGVFAGETDTAVTTFRQGAAAYAGAHDTLVRQDQPAAAFGTVTPLVVDLDDNVNPGNQPVQSLVRFDALFGNGPGQVPPGAIIVSAKLALTTGGVSGETSMTATELHRMLIDWDETATWNSLAGGVDANDIDAAATPEFTLRPTVANAPAIFDVTTTVQAWQAGALPNRGWALLPVDVDGWRPASSESATVANRPALEVTFLASLLEFDAASYSVNESAGLATIAVTRRGLASGAVTVDYATVAGTASPGTDYTPVSGTLSWPANDTTPRTFTVPIIADGVPESIEALALVLSAPTAIAVIGPRGTAALNIVESPIDAWRAEKFGADATSPNAADTADPDSDGLANLLEYAFGSEPLNSASSAQPYRVPGDYLAISFMRPTSATDITYTVQVSADLIAWRDGSSYSAIGDVPSNAFTTQVSRAGSPVETIVVRDNVLVTDAAHRAMRMRVTRP